MLDVNQIMKDLASMVHEQGDTIDSVEDYIQTTSSHVESANHELAKASHYQKFLFPVISPQLPSKMSLHVEVHLRSLPLFLSLSVLLSDYVYASMEMCVCV
ncbi:syntaxin-12-like isoform X1 [Carassius auratus]|uniref:Syntaxin-12-like isoform X1 n=1 Tax=Carassius auratus TaxID=7957 RepID=A0A6P6LIR3_CARAU|nr:syntaxin-12-like isoform X1 [Carassius auratus]